MSEHELIDLRSLTNKELLVRLATKFEGMETDIKDIKAHQGEKDKDQQGIKIGLAVVKTKVVIWGSIAGAVTTAVIAIGVLIVGFFVK